jgi:hypothetical protein
MRQKVLSLATLSVLTLSCSEVASPPGQPTDRPGASPPAFTATVHSVSVKPSSASIGVGGTIQLSARAKPPKDATFVWSSSSTSVAIVSVTGLVTGVAAGSVTITATSNGKSDDAVITVTAEPPPPPPPGTTEMLVGAGDIASCSSSGDEATATLLDNLAGSVFTAGDNAYPDGTSSEYANCYDPTWGRHKARTRPSPGNHEYHTSGAAGYFDYFGSSAGSRGQGYYSYDLGEWHIIALNSNISMSAGSAQEQWLRADLEANTKGCTIAYWHHPRFSSGTVHGSLSATQPLWEALYDFDAEIVISGHEHNYERFKPQTPSGGLDEVNGIREFVVGTGGVSHYNDEGTALPNSEVFNGTTWGVLQLTLGPGTYTWEFVPVAGQTFTDAGSGTCH